MKKYFYCFVMIMMIGVLTGCSSKPVLELKQDIFTLELGDPVNLDYYYYLNTDELSEEVKAKLVEEVQLEMNIPDSSTKIQNDKTYPLTGTYEGSITFKKETVNFTVEVRDRVAPMIEGLKSIELAAGTEFNYSNYFTATDLNDMEEIQYDTSAIDINTEGTYTLKISVKDAVGNEGIKEVPVIIKSVSDTQESSSEVVTAEDGSQSYVTTVTDKPVAYEPPASPSNQDQYNGGGSMTQAPAQNTASNNNPTSNNETTPPAEPDRTESACTSTTGNSNQFFDTWDEADAYGLAQRRENSNTIRGYAAGSAGCGKFTVNFIYK